MPDGQADNPRLLRERLKQRGLSQPIIRELEQMVPAEVIPVMRAILGESDATIKQINAQHREVHGVK